MFDFSRLSRPLTPTALLAAALLAATAIAAATLFIASAQPWMGLRLTAGDLVAGQDGLRVLSIAADGPAAAATPALARGATLTALGAGTDRMTPEAADIIPEPDALETYGAFARFLQRQDALHGLLSAPTVTLGLADGASLSLTPAPRRPVTSLPAEFWVLLGVGLTCFLTAAWVWSLRRRDPAAWLFAAGGAGIMTSALAAAIYSTRELALDGALFRVLSAINQLGASTFGVATICLFLIYPRRLAGPRAMAGVAAFVGLWWVGNILWLYSGPGIGQHLITALQMGAILVCIGLQIRATRRDPAARAAIRWLGLSVAIGAGAFILIIVLPSLFGAGTVVSQAWAFLSFVLIYVGMAIGVARYRLFELEDWAFKILFYMGGVALLLVLDAALIFVVALDRAPAFGLSLVIVAFVYLPLRGWLAARLTGARAMDRESLFRRVTEAALSASGEEQARRWRALLETVFTPLSLSPAPHADAVRIEADGAEMLIPGAEAAPTMRLRYTRNGRRLFAPRDRTLGEELSAMLRHTVASRRAYESGATEERARIARDMHDNIGAQLLSALHSDDPARKDTLIRQTMTDVRDILNNTIRAGLPFDQVVAGLRAETADRLDAAGITLDWRAPSVAAPDMSPRLAHAMRSVVREAATNTIRHAGATRMMIGVGLRPDALSLSIEDDGRGFDPGACAPGAGLGNMRDRIAALGGRLEIETEGGVRLRADIPLSLAAAA